MDCEQLQDVAADLAAGTLAGEERAEAMAHVAECAACRDEVAALADVVDGLLLLAPPVEPPAGFESRVLARFGGPAVTRARRGPRRVVWLAAAAAVALVVGLGVLGGVVVGGHDLARPPVLAALRARDGRDVGRAVLASGHPGWVLVDVAGLGGSESYAIELDLGHGRLERAGTVALVNGRGTARVRLSKSGVVGVHLVSLEGDYECQASFT